MHTKDFKNDRTRAPGLIIKRFKIFVNETMPPWGCIEKNDTCRSPILYCNRRERSAGMGKRTDQR
jgi:hypothetical protein